LWSPRVMCAASFTGTRPDKHPLLHRHLAASRQLESAPALVILSVNLCFCSVAND
jgi:hypothetical protein